MTNQDTGKIELLAVDLLDRHRPLVNSLKQLSRSLSLEFGWHYLLDLAWILNELGNVKGKRILDAGSGTGMIQWHLAQQGAEVISVDRAARDQLPLRFRARFRVEGLRKSDLLPSLQVLRNNLFGPGTLKVKAANQARDLMSIAYLRREPGRVIIYNQDLKNLADIATGSVDAVVAVSALEHNEPADLEQVVPELLRVLKPGGRLAATLPAARDQDWYHTPSSGWCYSEASLRRLFSLPGEAPANYDRYNEYFEALRDNQELRDGLASFYFHSGKNGMPWGVWDPQYLPVGVLRIKEVS